MWPDIGPLFPMEKGAKVRRRLLVGLHRSSGQAPGGFDCAVELVTIILHFSISITALELKMVLPRTLEVPSLPRGDDQRTYQRRMDPHSCQLVLNMPASHLNTFHSISPISKRHQ